MSRIHRPGRMPAWQRWSVLLGMSLCAISGVLFWVGHELHIAHGTLGSRWVLTLHGVSASLAVFLFGTVMLGYVRVGVNFRRQMFTGISNLIALSILVISSWLLYYGDEEWRDNTVLIHWSVGLLFAVIFLAHLLPLVRGAFSQFTSNHPLPIYEEVRLSRTR